LKYRNNHHARQSHPLPLGSFHLHVLVDHENARGAPTIKCLILWSQVCVVC
jgi:hypothetical protein